MNQDLINKLPPDAKKEFLKYAIKFDEKRKQNSVQRNNFSTTIHIREKPGNYSGSD